MGKVHKKIDSQKNLVVYTIVGKITAKEIMEAIQEFYGSQVTRKVLWDLSKGDASDLTSSEIRSIVQTPRKGSNMREGGKTAIVAPDDVTFGLSRMYGILTEGLGPPFETRSFRSVEEAYQWLLEKD